MKGLFLNPARFRWLDKLPAPRMPRWRKRGQHHADAIRIDLFTATVPVKQTPDRPPWDRETAAQAVLVPEPRGDWGTMSEGRAAEAEQMAEAYLP